MHSTARPFFSAEPWSPPWLTHGGATDLVLSDEAVEHFALEIDLALTQLLLVRRAFEASAVWTGTGRVSV